MYATGTQTPITPENAREVFMNAARAVAASRGGVNERRRLLQILQNNDATVHDVFATCVNEGDVVLCFIWSSSENDVDLLQALHNIGMNVDAKDQDGFCALRNASYNGKIEAVHWLLDHNVNIDIQDEDGWTPFMYACSKKEFAIMELLLQNKANPDIQDTYGWTALISAVSRGDEDIVQFLLSHNASVNLAVCLDSAATEEIKEMLQNHVDNSYVLK